MFETFLDTMSTQDINGGYLIKMDDSKEASHVAETDTTRNVLPEQW